MIGQFSNFPAIPLLCVFLWWASVLWCLISLRTTTHKSQAHTYDMSAQNRINKRKTTFSREQLCSVNAQNSIHKWKSTLTREQKCSLCTNVVLQWQAPCSLQPCNCSALALSSSCIVDSGWCLLLSLVTFNNQSLLPVSDPLTYINHLACFVFWMTLITTHSWK